MKNLTFIAVMLIFFDSVKAQGRVFYPSTIGETENLYPTDTTCPPKCFIVYWKIGRTSGQENPVDSMTAHRWVNYENQRYGAGTHWIKNICNPQSLQKKKLKKDYKRPRKAQALSDLFILVRVEGIDCIFTMPWWITIVLAFVGIFVYKQFYEFIITGIIIYSLFAIPDGRLLSSPIWFSITISLIYIGIQTLRRSIIFYKT